MTTTTPDSSVEKVGDVTNTSKSTNAPEIPSPVSALINQDTEVKEDSIDITTDSNKDAGGIVTETPPLGAQGEDQETKHLTKFEEALHLRDKLDALIRRTVQTKKRCEKLDHDNKYLQEYVGNLMNSGDFLSKRV